jgi:uncharacterized protein YdeI (YjbR/CyaY-like superfamily)
MEAEGRVLHHDWDLFDTRHVVFKPQRLTPQQLEAGYWRAYRDFYRWGSIWRGASSKKGLRPRLRHMAYAGGWKKFEPLWDLLIRSKQVLHALPVLETILTGFGSRPALTRVGDDSSEHPGAVQVDAVAPHRDALREQELALPPPHRQAAVGSDDAMPRQVIVDGREHKPHQPRRAGVDVAIGPDKPFGNGAHAPDDARPARLRLAGYALPYHALASLTVDPIRSTAQAHNLAVMDMRFFKTPDEFRAWLVENHATATEIGVVFHRKASGKPTMTWSEAVDQALCFGWIDSIARRIDETSRVQRFSPRKPKSNWSAVNIKKVGELKSKGLMAPAGLAAFARREEARSGVYSYENRHLAALDPERHAMFKKDARAWEFFGKQPPSYRQTAIYWVMNAKREETRSKRLARLIEVSGDGRRLDALSPSPRR